MRLLSEESGDESLDQEVALSKAVDVMEQTMGTNPVTSKSKKEKHREYEHECREKLSTGEVQSKSEPANKPLESVQDADSNLFGVSDSPPGSGTKVDKKPIEEERMLSYHRKVTVLYELLSACLADRREDNKKCKRRRKGYDARHRVSLRLLATWLDVKWTKMVCILN